MGIVNASIGASDLLPTAQMGITVDCMDSTEYAAAVADKARKALEDAGESVSSASLRAGIPRSTLDRKFNSGKGVQALTVRELFDLATLAGTTPADLAKVYEVPAASDHDVEAMAS